MKLVSDTYTDAVEHEGKEFAMLHGKYEITPMEAQRLLDNQPPNRRIQPTTVSKIARAFMDGNFKDHGIPLLLDENGQLLDGQHRLTGQVAVGKTVQWPVVSGVPRAFFPYLGHGPRRTIEDAFKYAGIKNPGTAKQVVTFLWQEATTTERFRTNKNEVPAPPEALDLFLLFGNPEANELDEHIVRANKAQKVLHIHAGAVGALSYLYGRENKEENERFWEGVIDGLGIYNVKDPRKALSNYIRRRWENRELGTETWRINNRASAVWVHYAWRNYLAGKQIGSFQPENKYALYLEEIANMATRGVNAALDAYRDGSNGTSNGRA